MDRMLNWLAGPQTLELAGGGRLRLLTAMEVLQARREAAELAADGGERALCANACLLARALEWDGKPVFPSGRAALEGLRVEEIAELSERWGQFSRAAAPTFQESREEMDELKKGWGTRLISAFGGVCSARFRRSPQRSGPNG